MSGEVALPGHAADPVQAGMAGAETQAHQFVTFVCNGEVFAVDMAPLQAIIRVPDIVRVPMAPKALDGLANLRGNLLPIVSLARLFGFAEKPHDDASRVVVIDLGQPLGFVVDRVASVVHVEPQQMVEVDAIPAPVNSQLLKGLLKDVGGHAITMVLDCERVIASAFSHIAAPSGASADPLGVNQAGSLVSERDPQDHRDELQLVSFEVAGQEYAVAIENVQEIVRFPDDIVRVPDAQSHVVGVMTLRQRLLPLVSLRRVFGLPEKIDRDSSRIVVISLDGLSVGVVTDTVNAVLRVNPGVVDPMPVLLARETEMSDITQICRIDGGKRLVSIISADHMFRSRAIREALQVIEPQGGPEARWNHEPQGHTPGRDDGEQFVVFRLDQEEFGMPIASVEEIVRVPEALTPVPRSPDFVEGMISLRGAMLPVINLRVRLGLPAQVRNDRQRIMVCLLDGMHTGFIVDSVTEVLKIHPPAISTAPCLSKQQRMIQPLDPEQLLAVRDSAGLNPLPARSGGDLE